MRIDPISFVLPLITLSLCLAASAEPLASPEHRHTLRGLSNLPISFEPNRGQTDKQVRFLARGEKFALFLTRREAVLSLGGGEKQSDVLTLSLAHSRAADPAGVNRLDAVTNYFIGKDPANWHADIPNYSEVKYTGVYPGVDLIYHGEPGQLEYDFVIAPGFDPNQIQLLFRGASKLRVNSSGDLVINVGKSQVVERAPVIYQEIGGKRETVKGNYKLGGNGRAGFQLESYDRSRPLIIDPVLSYSTYLGGTNAEEGDGIAIDAAGNAYVTGFTSSSDFPTTAGAFQTTLGGTPKIFVTKLNPTGTGLVYSTFLGGSGLDEASDIAVDEDGSAYLAGTTESLDFPITPGAFLTTGNGGECFVTKLNATGSALLYSTYLAGTKFDGCTSIALDSTHNAYVTGYTYPGYPITPGAFRTIAPDANSAENAFVTKLNATGSALIYSTFLGVVVASSGHRQIAVDSTGNAYIAGETQSSDFPTTPGAFQRTLMGNLDLFVSKLNAAGSGLVYSTLLGGDGFTYLGGIAIDSAGSAYVAGAVVGGSDYPTTPGAYLGTNTNGSASVVSKLDPSGSALAYSTYLDDYGLSPGIALDALGNAYLARVRGTFGSLVFVSKLNSGGSDLLFNAMLNPVPDNGLIPLHIAVDSSGHAYVTGVATSSSLPATPGAFQTKRAGVSDAFVTKIDTNATEPIITLTGVVGGPPVQILFSSVDGASGMASITVLKCVNCTASTDPFTPGTKQPVVTTATKIDQAKNAVISFRATDVAGGSTLFDPVDLTVEGNGSAEVKGVIISPLEHMVLINNGKPGIRSLVLHVHGKQILVGRLEDGESRSIDIGWALAPGRKNEVAIVSFGAPGSSSSIVFTQP